MTSEPSPAELLEGQEPCVPRQLSPSLFTLGERWWHILRAHRPSQLAGRLRSLVLRRLFRWLPRGHYHHVDGASRASQWNGRLAPVLQRHLQLRAAKGNLDARVAELRAGRFRFLNEPRTLAEPRPGAPLRIQWSLSGVAPVSHLWRFHLHYHEFLLDLMAAGGRPGECPGDPLWELVDDWIGQHRLTSAQLLTDAWHPFCLSKRIAVWLLLWQYAPPPEGLRARIAASLEGQTRYLERHLEWDLRGNHLLENLRTLVLAGACFDESVSRSRLRTAGRWLRTQLDEQLLPSGEHFERSPMYHAQMLSAILDVRDAAEALEPNLSEACAQASRRMADCLEPLLHPDGEIPLLSDSALDETPAVRVLLEAARRDDASASTVMPGGGVVGSYWTWRDGGDYLLLDAGPVGADELPAHAHCDLLTIEASLQGRRVIVDSGVFEYASGNMRTYCRSTAAHNVLQVDDVEQCDMWSRFRMGRRGRPTGFRQGETGPFRWVAATHDAFRRAGVPVTGRWIACRSESPWIITDWADGAGEHTLVHWLHLSPEVRVHLWSDDRAELDLDAGRIVLRYHTAGQLRVVPGWYCPDFGVRQRSAVLRFECRCRLPHAVVWSLRREPATGTVSVDRHGGLVVRFQDDGEEFCWSPLQSLAGRETAPLRPGR